MLAGVVDRRLDEPGRGVHADGLTIRADQRGERLRRVAEAAPDVEHALTGLWRGELDRHLAVLAEAGGQQVLEAQEAIEQRPVPGLDRLGVRVGPPAGVGGAHRPDVRPFTPRGNYGPVTRAWRLPGWRGRPSVGDLLPRRGVGDERADAGPDPGIAVEGAHGGPDESGWLGLFP